VTEVPGNDASTSQPRTWPDDWKERKEGKDCPACAEGRTDDTGYGVRFFSGEVADAYLCRRATLPGYSVVVFRDRHVADLMDLTPKEVAAFFGEVQTVARLLTAVFKPAHVNYDFLGNAVPHVHGHVVLRYVDDPAPGRPIGPPDAREMSVDEFRRQLEELRAAAEG